MAEQSAISATERLQRLMIEVTPFRVGQRVTVSPGCKYVADWRGGYVITAMRWEFQHGSEVNYSIASDDEIVIVYRFEWRSQREEEKRRRSTN